MLGSQAALAMARAAFLLVARQRGRAAGRRALSLERTSKHPRARRFCLSLRQRAPGTLLFLIIWANHLLLGFEEASRSIWLASPEQRRRAREAREAGDGLALGGGRNLREKHRKFLFEPFPGSL